MTGLATHPFAPSVALIRAGPATGTGYLVAPDRVATCWHVVSPAGPSGTVALEFESGSVSATVIARDEEHDAAVLALAEPVMAVPVLPLGGAVGWKNAWDAFGYPGVGGGAGVPLEGVVTRPDGRDDARRPAIVLRCEEIAAGLAAPAGGFSGSPVVVNGAVIGHLKRIIADKDFRGRPCFGLVWATPASAVAALLGQRLAPAQPPGPAAKRWDDVQSAATDELLLEVRSAAAAGPRRLLEIWERWRAAGLSLGDAALPVAQEFLNQCRPHQALEVLDDLPPDGEAARSLRGQQLRALALSRLRRPDDALQVLTRLTERGANDPETLGLMAGRLKEQGLRQKQRALIQRAHDIYQAAWSGTGDSYNGINTASTALQLGLMEEGRDTARRVAALLDKPADQLSKWDLASRAEARHIAGLGGHESDYAAALAREPMALEHIAVMRRQARLNAAALGTPDDWIARTFSVPRIAAFSGHMTDSPDRAAQRFPRSKVGAVRRALRERIATLGIGYGLASAARGADLLFLEELLERGGRAMVFLPFPAADFVAASVGDDWRERFDRVMNDARIEIAVVATAAPPPAAQPGAFSAANRALQRQAIELARQLEEEPMMLAVWDGEPGSPGGTGEAIQEWQDEGYPLELIDITTL